jgi:hypothetical protein
VKLSPEDDIRACQEFQNNTDRRSKLHEKLMFHQAEMKNINFAHKTQAQVKRKIQKDIVRSDQHKCSNSKIVTSVNIDPIQISIGSAHPKRNL